MTMPEFRILGPLEASSGEGEPLALGGRKQRALLALLVLRANHVVSIEAIVDALWGEHPPRTAATSLQNSVHALRKLLGPDLLLTRAPGYVLTVDPEAIDLGRFERLVAEARGLEPESRSERLREALAVWHGDPLAEVAFEPFAAAEIRRLEELRIAALEDRIDADLACGRHAELVPELVGLVTQYPLRERLVGQLMVAHYQSGRQDDALRVFQDARQALGDLGLEPSPQLQQLQREILLQTLPRPRPASKEADEAHFAEVTEAMLAGRLVPVLGTDVGVLAEELARRFDYPEDGGDLTRVAQFVALTKGSGRLYDELRALLASSAVPTPVHRFFAALPKLLRDRGLPHQLLVTTSYDLALEQALLDAGEEFDVVSYLASGRDRGRFCHREGDGTTRVVEVPNTYVAELSLDRRTVVLKLHGGIAEDRESFVVTEDDYIGYLARTDVLGSVPVTLAATLRRSHFLFLGYGMREWSLRLVLDRISAGEPLAYRSWAVVPQARPLERQFWQARDVDLVELELAEYSRSLGRYLGMHAEAVA
jgi:DNA-binding SARP family transcriptional activator